MAFSAVNFDYTIDVSAKAGSDDDNVTVGARLRIKHQTTEQLQAILKDDSKNTIEGIKGLLVNGDIPPKAHITVRKGGKVTDKQEEPLTEENWDFLSNNYAWAIAQWVTQIFASLQSKKTFG